MCVCVHVLGAGSSTFFSRFPSGDPLVQDQSHAEASAQDGQPRQVPSKKGSNSNIQKLHRSHSRLTAAIPIPITSSTRRVLPRSSAGSWASVLEIRMEKRTGA